MKQYKAAIVLVVLLGLSFAATSWVESGFRAEMSAPEIPLSEISCSIGDWTGEDVSVDEEVVQVIDAHSIVNRMYRTANGEQVSVHIAAFTDPIYRASAPHHPTVCYPAAGWEVMDRRDVEIAAGEELLEVCLILFQRRSKQVVTAHWYRVGERTFTSAEGMQAHFAQYWGAETCPCINKVLLQVDVPTIEQALPILERFIPELKQAGLDHI